MRIPVRRGALCALASTLLCAFAPASAGPAEYVFSPIVEQGEREIDFKTGSAKLRDGSRASQTALGFGWGATGWWFTEIEALWHKEPGEQSGFDAWEWENRFQFTETGKYPLDIGLLLEIERPKDHAEGYEVRWGPLLQADLSSEVQANLNLLWTKHYRATEAGASEFGYQWQTKYRWRPEFEVGLQGFGGVGPWKDWVPQGEQAHVAGPALFGRVRLGPGGAISYNAGWLFGLTDGAPKNTFRLQAEVEF